MSDQLKSDVFFREWCARRPGSKRSRDRARAVAEGLGLLAGDMPVLTVVGSKGKGTAATFASAHLAAAGYRVLTVTSPNYRSLRERIRVNGAAIDAGELASLREALGEVIARTPDPQSGYLAPTGLFTIAGMLHARSVGADVAVLEAGMGGGSDEVSLFPPTVMAITTIFGEHLGQLGDTPAEIAVEKATVVDRRTRSVLSLPQTPDVMAALEHTVSRRTHGDCGIEIITSGSLPNSLLPPAPGRANARLGHESADRLLDLAGARVASDRLHRVISTVRLPGRMSWHPIPGTDFELLADAAINRTGVAAALAAARRRWGGIGHVLACFPDHKDLDGAVAELSGLPVTFVRLGYERLKFQRAVPDHWEIISAEALDRSLLSSLGSGVVALGTVPFIGHILDLVDANTENSFELA